MTPEEFWSILHDIPESPPVFYRLYHDDQGMPIVYSMEDLPGQYIEIDQATYQTHCYHVRVIDGRLVQVDRPSTLYRKLRPNPYAGVACHPHDICVIVDEAIPHLKWSKNES
jgi:hypothetical protein